MKKWIIGLGGLLLIVALGILGRDGRQLKKTEAKIDSDLATRTKSGMVRAEKFKKQAGKHSGNAKIAAEMTRSILEKRSEKDPDMDDLLSDWKSKRVRK